MTELKVQWQEPGDEERTWRKTGGPFPMLYHDVERVMCAHSKLCWDTVGSPMVREHELRIMDGWFFRSGSEVDAAADARMHASSMTAEEFGTWYDDVLRPEVVELVTRLRKHPSSSKSRKKLVAHFRECAEAFGHIMGDLHWRMAGARLGETLAKGKPTFEFPARYAEITGRPESEGAAFVGGLENEMTACIDDIKKVARVMQKSGQDSSEFDRAFKRLLKKHGHRTGSGWGSNSNLASPTWNVRPEIPMQMVATYAKADLGELKRKERAVAKERKRLEKKVRKELAKDPERLAMFEKELHVARRTAYYFEDHNNWMDQSSPGLVRDAAHVIGLHLVRKGKLDDPEDVLHLSLAELDKLPKDIKGLIAKRKAEFARQQALDVPEFLGPAPTDPGMRGMNDEGEGQKGNVLHGIAASSGTYTGRARVFPPSPIVPDLDDGDILVAVDAGPDWTPLFAILGAVVLDKGAAWQHAGVVAREYGLPAVTGTKTGTTAIADGSTITVDGDTGTVTLGIPTA